MEFSELGYLNEILSQKQEYLEKQQLFVNSRQEHTNEVHYNRE